MNNFGFIITRHVNSENTNRYWNRSVKLLSYETLDDYKKVWNIGEVGGYG